MHDPIPESSRQLILALEQPTFLIKDGVILLSNKRAPSAEAALQTILDAGLADASTSVTGEGWIFTLQPLDGHTLVQARQIPSDPIPAAAAQALRLPLNELLAATHALLPLYEDLEDDAQLQTVAQMNRSMYRLLRAAANIDFLRTESLPLRMEPIDLTAFLRQLCEEAKFFCRMAKVRLAPELPSRSIRVLADRQLLERSILNLLSNAIRSAAPGSYITLRLSLRQDRAVIELCNSADQPVALSDIFDRGEAGPAAPDQGAGLGLRLVRRFAELHHGVFLFRPTSVGAAALLALPVCRDSCTTFRMPSPLPDYAGGRNHMLVELSDVLPAEAYSPLAID